MIIETAMGETSRLHKIGNTYAIETMPPKQSSCGFNDLVAVFLSLFLADAHFVRQLAKYARQLATAIDHAQ